MRVLLPVLGVFILVFAAAILFFFKQGLDSYTFARSLQSVTITPPAGWDAAPYQTADGEAISGAPFDPAPVAATTTNDILFAFESARLGNNDGVATTFRSGDEMIALRMQTVTFVPRRTSFAERLGYASAKTEPAPALEVFGSLEAVPFHVSPRQSSVDGSAVPVPVNYRYLTATVGDPEVADTVAISILTNSSDAALAALLDGFDLAAVNDRLPQPSGDVLAGLGFVPRAAGPLSDAPPRPTPAYRAMAMLNDGKPLDPLNQQLVTRIATFEITDMAGLLVNYPSLDVIRGDVLQLLEDGSAENAARANARLMANSGRAWNSHEYYVLSEVGKPGTSQQSLAAYLANGYEIAPEVLALVARLPETGVASAADETGARPAAQGGFSVQTCTLQNGVRRCVVGGN
ncbi:MULTISPECIES: hypothetical protein [unclassified Yoonia]|uniref:hypothetical protein n=1 Tax=unclassified Yoonia TaxID=2629118 RepID=UPI002B002AE0|nr:MULTISPECIES: hypothetical protein [unclassified Yoonia]